MWRMICTPDEHRKEIKIKVDVENLEANDSTGRAVIVDDYTFRLSGKPVHNKIESKFKFSDGKIIEHIDDCDASDWASQAYAGIWMLPGVFLGRIETIRRGLAMKKLRKFDPTAFAH